MGNAHWAWCVWLAYLFYLSSLFPWGSKKVDVSLLPSSCNCAEHHHAWCMHACMHNGFTSRFRACPFTQAGNAIVAALERGYHHRQAPAFAPKFPAQSAPPQTCKNGQGPTARVELPATLCRECTRPRAALNTCSAGNGQG